MIVLPLRTAVCIPASGMQALECELVPIGLAADFSPNENVWDLTGANTRALPVGVGTSQLPCVFSMGLESTASPMDTSSHF